MKTEITEPPFTVHSVEHAGGTLHVRDYGGEGPAFVMMHGFPDNLHIYDVLVPHLSAAGRRAVAFDFLGFGGSDKPDGAAYSFEQQLGDLEAVVDGLELDRVIPVGHDAAGPAALNFAVRHPDRAVAVHLMNAFYGEAPTLKFPEFIELFATKSLKALTGHIISNPQQFAQLLAFQRGRMQVQMSEEQRARYNDFLGPVIERNFTQKPSAGPAFAKMTFQLFDEVAANEMRLPEIADMDVPVRLIWGKGDLFLNVGVAEHLATQLRHARLDVVEAGHWPQIDVAGEVAALMLRED